MKIKKMLTRSRRDFTAEYECDHCGHVQTGYGYDDRNFHENVIPNMECNECGKTAGNDYMALGTKYKDNEVV